MNTIILTVVFIWGGLSVTTSADFTDINACEKMRKEWVSNIPPENLISSECK